MTMGGQGLQQADSYGSRALFTIYFGARGPQFDNEEFLEVWATAKAGPEVLL